MAHTDIQAYYEPSKRAFDETAFTALLGRPLPNPKPLRPFHMNSTLGELKTTWLGVFLFRLVMRKMLSMLGDAAGEEERHLAESLAVGMPLRSLVALSGGSITPKMANVLLHFLNHSYINAIATAIGRRA